MYDRNQLELFDVAPYVTPLPFARAGSQRWLQVALEHAPELLLDPLRLTLPLRRGASIEWRSPRADQGFREYQDMAALWQMGIPSLPVKSLRSFWPRGGPVWDALGQTSDQQFIFVEAKAHFGELFSPATQAQGYSRQRIVRSLEEVRRFYAPGSRADWSTRYYQYANRLAHHYLFRTINRLPSHMVFLFFTNAWDVNGPHSEWAWSGAIRRMHWRLGLPATIQIEGVHEIFVDVAHLSEYASQYEDLEPPQKLDNIITTPNTIITQRADTRRSGYPRPDARSASRYGVVP